MRRKPLRDAGDNVSALIDRIFDILDKFKKAGEIQTQISLGPFERIITLHVLIPPYKKKKGK